MSMISAQCDELRWLAEIYNRQKKPATSRVFREAADTIGELRDNLQRTNAENAKLRELVREIWRSCPVSEDDCVKCPHRLEESDEVWCDIPILMEKLGVKVDA